MDAHEDPRPLLALTVGDPAGIGPEICLKAIAEREVRAAARIVVLGPGALRPAGVPLLEAGVDDGELAARVGEQAWLDTGGPARFELGRAQAECGRAALAALRRGAELARAGHVAALVTGPVSKQALHLAGEPVEGQTELLSRWDEARDCQMLAVAGELRVLLLTRHLPLRRALELIDTPRVLHHLELLARALATLGFERPRLALAGLNPHAGVGGILGDEDARLLRPAVEQARARGLDVVGPLSPDTVFAQAARGRHDGVLALYHDQAIIPVKLLAPDTGLTVLAGLSYLRVSPVHGTAFDIAGRGLASHANLTAALLQAARWSRRTEPGSAPRGG
jgi:4-hydroxythreonine-4-phosphate dehydrogenase